MTIATYSELLTEIDAWMNRADLAARVPTFLKLFEARMNRQLRAPAMESTSVTSTEAATDIYALPDDFLSMRELYLATDPKTVLEAMTPAALRETYAYSDSGQPRAYAVAGEAIVLAPVPDGAYTLTMGYFGAIPALTVANPTNWLLTAFPDAYLYGTLTMAEVYLKDDERVGVWKAAWDECLAEMQKHFKRQRLPAGPLTMRPTIYE
jgi:hypothetical protein